MELRRAVQGRRRRRSGRHGSAGGQTAGRLAEDCGASVCVCVAEGTFIVDVVPLWTGICIARCSVSVVIVLCVVCSGSAPIFFDHCQQAQVQVHQLYYLHSIDLYITTSARAVLAGTPAQGLGTRVGRCCFQLVIYRHVPCINLAALLVRFLCSKHTSRIFFSTSLVLVLDGAEVCKSQQMLQYQRLADNLLQRP